MKTLLLGILILLSFNLFAGGCENKFVTVYKDRNCANKVFLRTGMITSLEDGKFNTLVYSNENVYYTCMSYNETVDLLLKTKEK